MEKENFLIFFQKIFMVSAKFKNIVPKCWI